MQLSDLVENIVGKGENAGYQHFFPCPMLVTSIFSLSHNLFRRLHSQGHLNLGIV